MPEPRSLELGALPAPLPLPPLALDGRPFPGGTIVVHLAEQRDGPPVHSTCVWHARIARDGSWSAAPMLQAGHRDVLAAYGRRSLWLVATWAGRRVGELRVKLGHISSM